MSVHKIGDLSSKIQALLGDYDGQVRKELDEIIPGLAKDTAKKIRATAPKRTGQYAKSWTSVSKKDVYYNTVATVYAENYRLPHLLEFGHATRNGGRTQPAEHIAPAEEWAAEEAVKRIKEAMG